ncbi:MAG: hypothetical protein KAY46_11090 [Burkholderiaceae bacterium]|nr:hypothetical protein [Burkholderiaceae bacterium]
MEMMRSTARAGAFLLACAFLLTAGCGGGGSSPDNDPTTPPEVIAFTADTTSPFVGDSVRLSAMFRGAAGRIEPGLGTVTSGQILTSPVIDRDISYQLIVESPGLPNASRTLAISPRFRDRYAVMPGRFAGSQLAAVAAADGTVLLIGGSRGEPTLSDAIDRFDPRTGLFTRVGKLAGGRALHRALRLPDGRILVSGGVTSDGDGRRVELIDERTATVANTGPMSVPRVDHAALLLPDGRVLVTGGSTTGELPRKAISDTAELWEPTTQTFRRVTQRMSVSRAAHTMTLLADGRVLIVGGYSVGTGYRFAEIFDPRDERFTPLAAPLALRANHAAHAQPDGRVLILGGETLDATTQAIVPLASVLRFDPVASAFTELAPLAAPRTVAGTALLPSGQVLLFGGQHDPSRNSGSAERYDSASGSQPIASLDGERAWHSVTRLASGRILIAGGEATGGAYAATALVYE